jgi:hypothetical protein
VVPALVPAARILHVMARSVDAVDSDARHAR